MVTKIYCLNRSRDSETSQIRLNMAKGLSTNFDKAAFLAADLAKPLLGLDEKVYKELLGSVNQIIRESF